jgi:hypothetical protein
LFMVTSSNLCSARSNRSAHRIRWSDSVHMVRAIGRGLSDLGASSRQLPRSACADSSLI